MPRYCPSTILYNQRRMSEEHTDAGRRKMDWRRTALVVQGGGMRSAFSAGALDGLSDDWRKAAGYGSSAGAINLAYFFCGQMEDLRRLYFELVLKRGVIRPWRLWRIIDVERLVRVMKIETPLRIPHSGLRLTVPVLRADNATLEYINLEDKDTDEVYDVLSASAAIPILYDRAVTLNGVKYVDGALLDTLPVERAVSDGMDQLLVISNRPMSARRLKQPFMKRTSKQFIARRSGVAVSRLIGVEDPAYNALMARLEAGDYGDAVRIIAPNHTVEPKRTETGQSTLGELWSSGRAMTSLL